MSNVNKHFKAIRRDSLRNEVDGLWDDLEEEEDSQTEVNTRITFGECRTLQRLLNNDLRHLPAACKGLRFMSDKQITTANKVPAIQSQLARKLSGAFPGAFNEEDEGMTKRAQVGGEISSDECHRLKDFLSSAIGGRYVLPNACADMFKREEKLEEEQYERENAEVYKRLKRRMTEMAKQDYPPTMV